MEGSRVTRTGTGCEAEMAREVRVDESRIASGAGPSETRRLRRSWPVVGGGGVRGCGDGEGSGSRKGSSSLLSGVLASSIESRPPWALAYMADVDAFESAMLALESRKSAIDWLMNISCSGDRSSSSSSESESDSL